LSEKRCGKNLAFFTTLENEKRGLHKTKGPRGGKEPLSWEEREWEVCKFSKKRKKQEQQRRKWAQLIGKKRRKTRRFRQRQEP